MQICIFEDDHFVKLLPLSYFRPVYELRCGIFTLRQKILKVLKIREYSLQVRRDLAGFLQNEFPGIPVNRPERGDTWFVNGRVIADDGFAGLIKRFSGKNIVLRTGGEVVAAFIGRKEIERFYKKFSGKMPGASDFDGVPEEECDADLLRYTWDIVGKTAEQIEKDFRRTGISEKIAGKIYKGAWLLNKKDITVLGGSVVKPGAVLDAEQGPIFIGKGVTIMPNAVIEGPAYIGDHSVVKIGAKIYHGTSIGERCKIGGEVENSVVHSHSNKQHEGFLGHSYLGSWVNIGADTNTSDLKNNYSSVRVQIGGETVDTKEQFVGLTMGDHSKTGINVMFDTGTVVGVCCNIFGAGLPPKYVPSFSWGGGKSFSSYDIGKCIETMRLVMARRNEALSESYEKIVRQVFLSTGSERMREGIV